MEVRSFPWATLGVNVVGSFVLGAVLAGPGAERWSATTTSAVTVGFLGAFTTFSTFAHETTTYIRTDRPGLALAYVGASLSLGLAAAAAGYTVGRPGLKDPDYHENRILGSPPPHFPSTQGDS